MITFYEFGQADKQAMVLIHPSAVYWDYFSKVIPFLKDYRVLVPALPGYDAKQPHIDFTGIEDIAYQLAKQLLEKGVHHIDLVYGCSMGGSIVARMVIDQKIFIRHAVMDGGITPYQLPWLVTRGIAVRDYLMITMGKYGGLKLLSKLFSTGAYTKEDLAYVARVLRSMSARTIWRTFESCNNYDLPDTVNRPVTHMQYWYGQMEQNDRKWDIAYMKKHFPDTEIIEIPYAEHGSMAIRYPERMASYLQTMVHPSGNQIR